MAVPPSDEDGGVGEGAGAQDARLRVDRYLWFARLFKSRSLAADAVAGGRVHLNGERVKPARALRAGDRLSVVRGPLEFECVVTSLPSRRGPASEAARCYEETAASAARRAAWQERMRLAPSIDPRPDGRPDKHERRELRRVRGRD
jgi:ribosome-associated heat shock protein Hsp15